MNPSWPDKPSSTETVKDVHRIKEALDWIAYDLLRPENELAWHCVQAIEPERSRIELFDMIWWMYFRRVEPYGQSGSSARSAAPAEGPAPERPVDGTKGDVLVFRGDDEPYLRWIAGHPSGYVVNAGRNPRPSYLKLHRATCTRISSPANQGAYTERDYIKICSHDRSALDRWARDDVGGTLDATCACL